MTATQDLLKELRKRSPWVCPTCGTKYKQKYKAAFCCLHKAAEHHMHADADVAANKAADTAPEVETVKPVGSQPRR